MNPLTNMKNVKRLGEQELRNQNPKSSWHNQYKDSAWIFVGGLPYELSEGDIICVFSQYGEIVNINYVRDKVTGKPKGFCFICYEDQKSTILAVDNLNGIKILGRIIRIDHVENYKPPKDSDKLDPETRQIITEGCAPKAHIGEAVIQIKSEEDSQSIEILKKVKKEKKSKSKKSKKSKHKKRSCSSSSSDSEVEKKSKKSKTKKVKRKDSSSESLSEGEKEILAVKEKRKQLTERLKSLEEVLKRKSLSNSNRDMVE